eukprot:TRINITY_DN153_c0_g1_i1.p1 TRINITY_DN153_c0_g1~~TRINITY_DN153_c0_g1_i1.p1  ORF type:complete len:1385 (-),score=426.31 TRINITY_DN153_c0_g1_i1:1563-5717(-)
MLSAAHRGRTPVVHSSSPKCLQSRKIFLPAKPNPRLKKALQQRFEHLIKHELPNPPIAVDFRATDHSLHMYKEGGGWISCGIHGPKSLNSLNKENVPYLRKLLEKWDQDHVAKGVSIRGSGYQAFSSGTDFKQILKWVNGGQTEKAIDYFKELYGLMFTAAGMVKPLMCPINGLALGAGSAGLALHSAYSTTTENTLVASTEHDMGWYMDCATALIYSKLGRGVGMYHALTGAPLTGVELRHLGAARFTFRQEMLNEFETEICKIDNHNNTEAWFHTMDRTASYVYSEYSLEHKIPAMERCFVGKKTMAEVIQALEDDEDQWSNDVGELLRQKSPLGLCITFELMNRLQSDPDFWPFDQEKQYFEEMSVNDIAAKLQALVNLDYNIKFDYAREAARAMEDDGIDSELRTWKFAEYGHAAEAAGTFRMWEDKNDRDNASPVNEKSALDIEPGSLTNRPIVKEYTGLDKIDHEAGYYEPSPVLHHSDAGRRVFRGTVPVVDPDEMFIDPVIEEMIPTKREAIDNILRDPKISAEEKQEKIAEYIKVTTEEEYKNQFIDMDSDVPDELLFTLTRREEIEWEPSVNRAREINLRGMIEFGEDKLRTDAHDAGLANKATAKIISSQFGKQFYEKIKNDRPARNVALARHYIQGLCGAESRDYMSLLKRQLKMEYLITQRVIKHPDFKEALTATLIDKRKPKWTGRIEDYTPEYIASIFDPVMKEGEVGLFLEEFPNSNHNWIDGAWRGFQLSNLQARDGWFKEYVDKYRKALDLVTFGYKQENLVHDPVALGEMKRTMEGDEELTPEFLEYMLEKDVFPILEDMSPMQLEKLMNPGFLERELKKRIQATAHSDMINNVQDEYEELYDERAMQDDKNMERSEPLWSEFLEDDSEIKLTKPVFYQPNDLTQWFMDRASVREGQSADEAATNYLNTTITNLEFRLPQKQYDEDDDEDSAPYHGLLMAKDPLAPYIAEAYDQREAEQGTMLMDEKEELDNAVAEPEEDIGMGSIDLSRGLQFKEKRQLERVYQRGQADRQLSIPKGSKWKIPSLQARDLAREEEDDALAYPSDHPKAPERYDINSDQQITNMLLFLMRDKKAVQLANEMLYPSQERLKLGEAFGTKENEEDEEEEEEEEDDEKATFKWAQKKMLSDYAPQLPDPDMLSHVEKETVALTYIRGVAFDDEPDFELEEETQESVLTPEEEGMAGNASSYPVEWPNPLYSPNLMNNMQVPMRISIDPEAYSQEDKRFATIKGEIQAALDDSKLLVPKKENEEEMNWHAGPHTDRFRRASEILDPHLVETLDLMNETDFDQVIDSNLVDERAWHSSIRDPKAVKEGIFNEPDEDDDDFIDFDTELVPVSYVPQRHSIEETVVLENRMGDTLEKHQRPL